MELIKQNPVLLSEEEQKAMTESGHLEEKKGKTGSRRSSLRHSPSHSPKNSHSNVSFDNVAAAHTPTEEFVKERRAKQTKYPKQTAGNLPKVGPLDSSHNFGEDQLRTLNECEKILANSLWLNGSAPTSMDKEALDVLGDAAPGAESWPHTFAWWSLASRFTSPMRDAWPAASKSWSVVTKQQQKPSSAEIQRAPSKMQY